MSGQKLTTQHSNSAREQGGLRRAGGTNDKPLISIVTASFNVAATIEATIDSVCSQGFRQYEFIVVDGASTDGTTEILKKRNDDIDYWMSEPDNGLYDAWNKGLAVAKGEYVAFLGADDIYLPGALEAYARFVSRNEGVQYVSSRVRYGCDADSPVIGEQWRWQSFRRYMNVAHVGSLQRRGLYERYGCYDESFRITGDYEFLLRAGPSLRAGFIPEITAQMGRGGLSSGIFGGVFSETVRSKRKHGTVSAPTAYLDAGLAMAKFFIRRLRGQA